MRAWMMVLAWLCAWPAMALTVRDSLGEQHFDRVPQRVVALTWEGAEQLLELGVTPLAVADRADYRRWVVKPALPPEVLDAGNRLEPNLEQLVRLKPDLIVAGPSLAALQPRLARIAPTLVFDAFRADHDNAQAARDIYRELARLFGRQALAERRLAGLDAHLAGLRSRVAQHFGGKPPPVCVVRFASPTSVYVYGDNAMSQYALQHLGLESACPQPRSAWGLAQRRVVELGALRQGVLLYMQPFDAAGKLFPTRLWQAMPFVRAGRWAPLAPTWSYGGVMSLGYLADALAESLLRMRV